MVSIVGSFRQQAASLAHSVLGWTDASNASLMSFGPLGCLLPLAFVPRLMLTLALPLGVVAAAASVASVRLLCARCLVHNHPARTSGTRIRTAAAVPPTAAAPHSLAAAGAASTEPPQRRDAGAQRTAAAPVPLASRVISVLLFVGSILYMPLLSACLRALDCYERPVDGVSYLRADLSLVCGSPAHVVAQIVAWLVLVGLGCGFPALIMLKLCVIRRQRSSHKPLSSTNPTDVPAAAVEDARISASEAVGRIAVWRPLYDGYDVARGVAWWEAVVLLRKASLAVAGSMLGSIAQGLPVTCALLVVSLALQEAVQPFEEGALNFGERVSLGGALVCAILATLYQSGAGTEGSLVTTASSSTAVTAAIAIVTACSCTILLLQWATAACAPAAASWLRRRWTSSQPQRRPHPETASARPRLSFFRRDDSVRTGAASMRATSHPLSAEAGRSSSQRAAAHDSSTRGTG